MVRSVEDLVVFQKAYALSLMPHQASLGFPRIEQWALADQIRRSSKSVCANIVEGFSRQGRSPADYRRYLIMAMGSSDETQLWLRYAVDLGYVERDQGQKWRAEYGEISRMLQGIQARWAGYTPRPDP